MKRGWAWLLFLLLPVTALADGKVVPTAAYPAAVSIPDQRALIHFTNDTERLVIETRFTGAGTNFAWVIPLPNPPEIEEATPGLFPTLQYLFRPRIRTEVTRYYLGALAFVGLGYLLLYVRPRTRVNALDVAACLFVGAAFGLASGVPFNGVPVFALLLGNVVFVRRNSDVAPAVTVIFVAILGAMALHAFEGGHRRALASASVTSGPVAAVSILDRRLVGVYETTTLGAQDPKALQTWLSENGYALSTNAGPVVESYVKQGWVFVAAKIRRDSPSRQTSTPHPLSFTFKTDKPVYPLRLTGIHNGPLEVELYVFGPGRVKAPHFRVERCTKPSYPLPPDPRDRFETRLHETDRTIAVLHPLLRRWVLGAAVATKCSAILWPDDMQRDVWLEWEPFAEADRAIFSDAAAWTLAFNWGSGVLSLGLVAALLLSRRNEIQKRMLPAHIRVVVITAVLSAAAIFVSLPKTEVRLARDPAYRTEETLNRLCDRLSDTNEPPADGYQAEVHRLLANPASDMTWNASGETYIVNGWKNELLGGQIRPEDSPGNFLVRESGNFVQFVAFDAYGAEHVLDSWYLPRHP